MAGRVAELSEGDYRHAIDVDQVGTFLGMRAVVAPMSRARGGAIVNMSSTAGLVGTGGLRRKSRASRRCAG